MIDINLLPQEYRQIEGTPKPRLVVTYVGVAAVLVLGALLGYYYLHHITALRVKEDLQTRKVDLEKKAKVFDDLQRQIARLKKRRDVVAKLWQKRIVWSRKLDELIDLVPKYVRVDRITLRTPEQQRGKRTRGEAPQGKLIIACKGNTEDTRYISSFYRVLLGELAPQDGEIERSRRFAGDFVTLGHDGGRLVDLELPPEVEGTNVEKPKGWEVNITLFYEEPVEEKPAARPAAASGQSNKAKT